VLDFASGEAGKLSPARIRAVVSAWAVSKAWLMQRVA
jgi:hypothetical protein